MILYCMYVYLGGPRDNTNIRILQQIISGKGSDALAVSCATCSWVSPLTLGTRMSDPYVYVVFWAPIYERVSSLDHGSYACVPSWKVLQSQIMNLYLYMYIYIYIPVNMDCQQRDHGSDNHPHPHGSRCPLRASEPGGAVG